MRTVKIKREELEKLIDEAFEGFGCKANLNVDLDIYSDGEVGLSEYVGNQSSYRVIDGKQEIATRFRIVSEGTDFTEGISEREARQNYDIPGNQDVDWDAIAKDVLNEGSLQSDILEIIEQHIEEHNQMVSYHEYPTDFRIEIVD